MKLTVERGVDMADRAARRRTAPKRSLIGPVAMLLGGVAAGAVLWHVLMLDPTPAWWGERRAPEKLSQHDRDALDRVLDDRRAER